LHNFWLILTVIFRGIDLESMDIGQRDALLVFRTLCKVSVFFSQYSIHPAVSFLESYL
jgi:hypothetical protein